MQTSKEHCKITNSKHQITNKSQIPILKLPAASCRESSKCKELIHFIVVRSLTPQQATGNALAIAFSMTKTGLVRRRRIGHCDLFDIWDL
jgi:hypothetical protein